MFLDLETTSKNPNTTEILTAYLRTRRLSDFRIIDNVQLCFRPEKYIHDSFSIHGITEVQANSFDDKSVSIGRLFRYIDNHKSDSFLCCHANHHAYGNYGYFDEQVIRQVAFSHSAEGYYWYLKQQLKWVSTHTIAKNTIYMKNYSLNNVADYFNIEFNHHNAKSDVEAMEKIFRNLVPDDISAEELYNLGNYNGTYRRLNKQPASQLELQGADLCTSDSTSKEKCA